MNKLGLLIASLGTTAFFAAACSTQEAPQPKQRALAVKTDEAKELALAPVTGGGPIEKRIADLQASAQRQPEKVDTWILLGQAFVQKARQSSDPGFYLNADACARVALDKKPNYPLALSLRGLVLLNDHRFTEARELAESTLAQDPDNLIALGVRSDALLELGDVEGAEDAADKMMNLKPNLPSYSRAAHLRWLRGDIEGAKQRYRLAIDSGLGARDHEPAAWVIAETAKMFLLAGDYEGAEAGYDRALQQMPEFPPALIGKARAAIALKRFDEAARLAARAFELSKLSEAAWVWGDAARAAGKMEDAAKADGELIKSGQADKRTLAAFYATEGRNIDEAVRLAKEELKVRGDIYTHDVYAWALYRAGRIPEAKAESERVMRLGTKDAQLLYHSGAIAIAAGEVERGVKEVKEALAISPKFQVTGAREAVELLSKHGVMHAAR